MLPSFKTSHGETVHINPLIVRVVAAGDGDDEAIIWFDDSHKVYVSEPAKEVARKLFDAIKELR